MTISLLNAVKAACGESGIEPPSTVIANTEDQTLRYIADAVARQQRQNQWQKLRKTGTVTMTTATEYALPADFWAYVADTLWPMGGVRAATLPTTPLVWTILKAGIGLNPATFNCRFLNNKLEVQNPQSGTVLRFEYISTTPITDSTGVTFKDAFTVDTDLFTLDETLFVMDLKWRIKKEKGINDWEWDKAQYEQSLNYRTGVDSGARILYPMSMYDSDPQPPYNNPWVS